MFMEIPVISCKILGFSWKFLARPGPDLPKTGPKLVLVAGGSLPCHRIDEFSKQNCPPRPPRDPRRPPRSLPGGFGKSIIFVFFLIFFRLGLQSGQLAHRPPRPLRGRGGRWAPFSNDVLVVIRNGHYGAIYDILLLLYWGGRGYDILLFAMF